MRYVTDWMNYRSEKETAVTLGKFDGVHRGHQKLIRRVRELAEENGWDSAIYTFDTSQGLPAGQKLLLTSDERQEVFRELLVDLVMACPFTQALKGMEAEDFVREILAERLRARAVIVGPDFRFGKDRKGSPEMLEELSSRYGFSLEVLPKEQEMGVDISSSRIRRETEAGHLEKAASLLGYPFFISGKIVRGRHLGHSLGFPTINLVPDEHKLLPPNGVCLSRTFVDGKWFDSISNIGCKPTVNGDALGVETHLLGCSNELYGENALVVLLTFTRPEKKFASLDELKEQIGKDLDGAKSYFARQRAEKENIPSEMQNILSV